MARELAIGITEKGVCHTKGEDEFDLDSKFRMVKESGVYDYIDKTPDADRVDDYIACSQKYDLPIRAGGWFYTLGRDEDLLAQNLEIGAQLGSTVHNTQIMMTHADGHLVTNDEVADTYMRAYEVGEKAGCTPTFEVHVNMWSEHFGRVSKVAKLVEARGVPYRMTLDHSHVIFKIDNPEEQEVLGMRKDVESGAVILDPRRDGNVCDEWIDAGYVRHCHARAAIPNNPKNIWGRHENGAVGRGIQYPFFQPQPGEYVADWVEAELEPWKLVVRRLMAHHAATPDSALGQISTEFIPGPDYGMGHKYSIFEHSAACARWLKETWAETIATS
ncbi:MAG: hypothetical protein HOM25_09540 [Rhodospirillaceae bacterium]|jgi:hypothetical protein|nr:hypothetical protein [Rhodospirillaceae bacterium]